MSQRGSLTKINSGLLASLLVLMTGPFSFAQSLAVPLGVMTAPRSGVEVGNSLAPSGTMVFPGDRITSREGPAIISFQDGSRLEMTQASAEIDGSTSQLVLKAEKGLFRFNFAKGQNVRIQSGRYIFETVSEAPHVGSIGTNRNGQVAMILTEGTFAVANQDTGEQAEVTPETPLLVLSQKGQGGISSDGKSLTDTSKSWQPDEHKGKCLQIGENTYEIVSNTADTVTIEGEQQIPSGTQGYEIKDCDGNAGAAAVAGAGAATAGAAGAGAAGGFPVLLVVGVAGGAGAGVAIYEATQSGDSR